MSSPANLIVLSDFLPPFRIGDRVRLKSGGPLLTVTTCYQSHCEVQWFEGQEIRQKIFPVAALSLYKKPVLQRIR